MIGRTETSVARLRSISTVQTPPGPSAELEKLLNATDDFNNTQGSMYDAETMVDELLTSRWEPLKPTFDTRESLAQQTLCLNALQSVMSNSIDRLVQHRKVVSNRIVELEHDSRQVSSKYQHGLEKPDLLLDDICVQLEDLEDRFTKVSSAAVTIGDKLSTLDNERSKALETEELMEALLALNEPSSKSTKISNRLFNSLHDPNQLHEASRIMKKMAEFSFELSSPMIAYAVTEIERLCQKIENNLLTEFSLEQEKGNLTGMCKCAKSLIEYNDKEKVADRYVWNVMCEQFSSAAGEPVVSSLNPIDDLDMLCTKIHAICTEQFLVINKAFPAIARKYVRELLVERLFNDPAFGILSLLDQFLKMESFTGPSSVPAINAESVSTAKHTTSPSPTRDYVEQLCSAFKKTSIMVAEIDAIVVEEEFEPQKQIDVLKGDAKNDFEFSNKRATTRGHESIRSFLDLQLHSLFGNHRERYAQAELGLLQDQFKTILATVQYPQPPMPIKTKGGGSKIKSAAVATTAGTSTSSPSISSIQLVSSTSITSMSSSNFEKYGGVFQPESSLAFYECVRELAEDAILSSRFEKLTNEAIDRCESVLGGTELHEEVLTKIITSFVAAFGEDFLATLLALTGQILLEQRLASDCPLQFFLVIEVSLKQIDFLNGQFETFIAPLQDFPTQLTICQDCHHKCLSILESVLATNLQKALTVIEKIIRQILTTNQGKGDFLEGQSSMSLSSSKACQMCTEFLRPLVTVICRVLVGENCKRFLLALALDFKELYLQHLRKFRFDPDGACMLLRDVSEYRDAFRSLLMPGAVDEIFDLLHEVANVYALPVENLGGFVREGKLALLNQQTLLQIIKRRWDYKMNAEKLSASLKIAKNAQSENLAP